MEVYVSIKVENEFNLEIPDGLSYEEAYNYILDNYDDGISSAIKNGEFYMEVEFPDGKSI